MFEASQYTFNAFALPSTVTTIAVFCLGFFVLIRERFSSTGRVFFLFCVSVCIWQTANTLVLFSGTRDVAWIWSHVFWLGVPFLAPSVLHFTLVILRHYSERRFVAWTSWSLSLLFCVLAFTTDRAVTDVHRFAWGFFPQYGVLAYMLIAYFLLIIAMVFLLYWNEYRQAMADTRTKTLTRGLVLGFGIAALSMVDFLPSFGVQLFPIGFAPILLFVVISVYTIWKYHLDPITPSFAANEIISTMSDPLIVCDNQGRVQVANPSFADTFGFEKGSVIGETIENLLDPSLKDEKNFLGLLTREHVRNEEMTLYSRNDSRVVVSLSTAKLKNDSGQVVGTVIIFHDITQRVRLKEELEYKTLHDELTGLPNRPLFMDRLEVAFKQSRRYTDHSFGVIFLDLDRFKVINDSLGHPVGDQLLQTVAERFERCLRSSDTVARFGGDEFGFLIMDVDTVGDVEGVAQKLLDELSRPFHVRGQKIFTNASLGIVLPSVDQYKDLDSIIRDADTAMYRAKNDGGGKYVIFNPSMHMRAKERMGLESDLQQAIEQDQLVLHYQPIVSLNDRRIHGLEALVRWDHPERGLLAPGDFLPLAENTGLLVSIDRWVLRRAATQMAQWRQTFPSTEDVFVSVNCSPNMLAETDLFQFSVKILNETGLDPSALKLEIVESTLMDNPSQTSRILSKLQEMGINILMDDFGTGYSSLSYLHSLPINTLKIDRSFIGDLESSTHGLNKLQITESIVDLAHNLKKSIIAEGIETETQLNQLREMDCELGQGFYFHKPLSPDELQRLFKTVVS